MEVIECNGINSFIVLSSRLLLNKGLKRTVRSHICYELPQPVCFKFKSPFSRLVTIHQRKWNIALAYAESLWIASGRNDINMIGHYLRKMKNFSDDGVFLSGAYGPRIRAFNNAKFYQNDRSFDLSDRQDKSIDQLKFVKQCFDEDQFTRQAIVQIGDPFKDCFDETGNKKLSKDFPCTRTLHFMKDISTGKLNLIVHMRSNDLLWGASAVNIFNFSFIHEYMANILKIEAGHYYHIVDNFHFYDRFKRKIIELSKIETPDDPIYKYDFNVSSLSEFNYEIKKLKDWEEELRNYKTNILINFTNDFFDDWAKVLFVFNKKSKVDFKNPILHNLIWNRS